MTKRKPKHRELSGETTAELLELPPIKEQLARIEKEKQRLREKHFGKAQK